MYSTATILMITIKGKGVNGTSPFTLPTWEHRLVHTNLCSTLPGTLLDLLRAWHSACFDTPCEVLGTARGVLLR